MNGQTEQPFDLLSQETRVARTARMLDEAEKLKPNQRKDIAERVLRFIDEQGLTQAAVAREVGISSTTISEVLHNRYAVKTSDKQLVRLHNWLELASRRENVVRMRTFVEHSVAREIIHVASIVAETCKIGVVFGPSQLGKTFTLKALEGDPRFGDPILVRVDESLLRPFALCRAIASRFDLSTRGTFDTVMRRVVTRLAGTKRMLMFDEIERAHYQTLEMLRDVHDSTGCGLLLCGKPTIYVKLGFREVGEFSEVTDQLAARIVVRRDLTERTRGDHPQPLFSRDDIRRLIQASGLKLHVTSDAEKWLQNRASTLGMGGLGAMLVCLYLAYKLAWVKGDLKITPEHLDDVADLSMGHEDAERVAEVVAESSGIRRVV